MRRIIRNSLKLARRSSLLYRHLCKAYILLFSRNIKIIEFLFSELKCTSNEDVLHEAFNLWMSLCVKNNSAIVLSYRVASSFNDASRIEKTYKHILQNTPPQEALIVEKRTIDAHNVCRTISNEFLFIILKESPFFSSVITATIYLIEVRFLDELRIKSIEDRRRHDIASIVYSFFKESDDAIDPSILLKNAWKNSSPRDSVITKAEEYELAKDLGKNLIILLQKIKPTRNFKKLNSIFDFFVSYNLKKEAHLLYQYLYLSSPEQPLQPQALRYKILLESIHSKFKSFAKEVHFADYNKGKKQKRLVFLTAIWKRYKLTDFVLNYYNNLFARNTDLFEFHFVVVGSEGQTTKDSVTKFNFHYCEAPNSPLSHKWQAGLDMVKSLDPDALLIVGSDDLINDALIRDYYNKLNDGHLIYGLKDIVVFSTDDLIIWNGYDYFDVPVRFLEAAGAGKLIAKPILKILNYNFWGDDKRNKGLDRLLSEKLERIGLLPTCPDLASKINLFGDEFYYGQVTWSNHENKTYLVDAKVPNENITSMGAFYRSIIQKNISSHLNFLAQYYDKDVVQNLSLIIRGTHEEQRRP